MISIVWSNDVSHCCVISFFCLCARCCFQFVIYIATICSWSVRIDVFLPVLSGWLSSAVSYAASVRSLGLVTVQMDFILYLLIILLLLFFIQWCVCFFFSGRDCVGWDLLCVFLTAVCEKGICWDIKNWKFPSAPSLSRDNDLILVQRIARSHASMYLEPPALVSHSNRAWRTNAIACLQHN